MKLSLFLIVLLGVVAISLGHCVPKDEKSAVAVLGINGTAAEMESAESEEGGVKKFFKNLGCEIVDAGRTVKEGVKSGYQYVKSKLQSNKDKEVVAEVRPIPNPEQNKDNQELEIDVRSMWSDSDASSVKP